MTSDAPLSELCSICYTEEPKYRCPRCKTRTCSLPCYKKHQQRASCNGKRDPAEYLKKSQLATPTAVDHDYNYLKGVEATIDHGKRDMADRGVDRNSLGKPLKRNLNEDSKLQHYFHTNQITVERAPPGMSRQKTNRTRHIKPKPAKPIPGKLPTQGNLNRGRLEKFFWTVEWRDLDGVSDIQQDCLECDTIEALRATMDAIKINAEKRTHESANGSTRRGGVLKKRRLGALQSAGKSDGEGNLNKNPISESSAHSASEPVPLKLEEGTKDATEIEQQRAPETNRAIESHNDLPISNSEDDKLDAANEIEAESSPSNPPIPDATSEKPPNPTETAHSAPNDQNPPRFFYLLKAHTPSSAKVLIPVDGTQTLTRTLQGQTVLEYPTFYVLDRDPKALPPGFMLPEQYEKTREREQQELDEAVRKAGSLGGFPAKVGAESGASGGGVVDANQILDMLKRDVTR